MKKILFLLTLITGGQSESQAQSSNYVWQKLFVFTKDKYTESGGTQQFVFDIDTLNPSKKTAFYGNWDKAYLYNDQEQSQLITNAPNAIFADGTSAGEIKFNPDYSYSTINNHTYANGMEYLGVYRSDSFNNNLPFSSVMYLKSGKFIPETSIKFSADVYIYPIDNNKFLLLGPYYGWDKDGKKTLQGGAIWDKEKGTLVPTNQIFTPGIKKVRTSNKDGTIVVLVNTNYNNMDIFWYGGEKFMDSLYPSIPVNGRINDVYVKDRQNLYVIWQNIYNDSDCKILQLDFAHKSWKTIATLNGYTPTIVGDGRDSVFFAGDFTQINGQTINGNIVSYSISKGTFTAMPKVYAKYGAVTLYCVGGALYLVSDYELLNKIETVYKLVAQPAVTPPAFVLKAFSGQNLGTKNTLVWSTASEQASTRFEIERSANNTTFTKLGEVTAKGNSTNVSNYTFDDNSPLVGDNYYRLKMVAANGTSSYSDTIKLIYTPVIPKIILTSFTAQKNGNTDVLNWTTSTEVESQKFEIERSSGGSSYAKIGSVDAKGNSTGNSTYSFIDPNPTLAKNDYRLKMITKDGKSTFSNVVEIDNSLVISVTLGSFEAKLVNGKTVLDWVMSSEIGNDHFDILRGSDSLNLSSIAKIESLKDSPSGNTYQFVDQNPLKGLNFYRLNIVYKNGQSQFSAVIKIDNSAQAQSFTVYPNPTSDKIWLNFPRQTGTIKIVNSVGQRMFEEKIDESFSQNPLDIVNWPTGLYFVVFQNQNGHQTLKLIKR